MPRLLPVVEGDGEQAAVPALLHRLLREGGHDGWFVDSRGLMKVGGLPAFRKKLDDYLGYLRVESPDAALFLFDLDRGCPAREAKALARRVRAAALPFPAAVVLAHREYEAWFLASIETIAAGTLALPDGLRYEGDPEERQGAKEWITAQMPHGKTYKPTLNQKPFTGLMDLDATRRRSRSFRRLCSALDSLIGSGDAAGLVTP